MSYQDDLAADALLSEAGHAELRLHKQAEQSKRPFSPLSEEQGRELMKYHHSGPRMNGGIKLAQQDPSPAAILDDPDATPEYREVCRGVLSWLIRAIDTLIENRPDQKLSGKQIALAILSGSPRFAGLSMRSIARSSGLSIFAVTKSVRELADDLFAGCEHLMGDIRQKPEASATNYAAARMKHLRDENHSVRPIPLNLETGLRRFIRTHPEREADILQCFPELSADCAPPVQTTG